VTGDGKRDQVVSVRAAVGEIEQWSFAARQRNTTLSELVRDAANAAVSATADTLTTALRDVAYASEPAPYSFDHGAQFSLIRDAFEVYTFGESASSEARDRLRRFERWQQDPKVRDAAVKFTTVSTSSASAVIPPGYLALFLAPEQDRPLRNAATRVPLQGSYPATPFAVPDGIDAAVVAAGAGGRPFVVSPADKSTATGAVADHTEGQNPAEGALSFGSMPTVTPVGKSGVFKVTRELVDASNPAIDVIALTHMREAYAAQCEQIIYNELNGSNGQAGTISNGFVPSGAQVSTSDANGLPAELKATVVRYPFRRGRRVRSVVCSQQAALALADLDPSSNVWLRDVTIDAAPAMPDGGADDADVFCLSSGDLYAWESPLLTFRFDERSGPAVVELALFGYFAARLLRPVGLAAIRVN
jgi:hypothetical protein